MTIEQQEKLKEMILQSIGEASLCWEPKPEGVFDSSKASEIGERLWLDIRNFYASSARMLR